MATSTNDSGNVDREKIARLLAQFKRLPSSGTSADRRRRDEVLDELQQAVGLSGQMVTENDILREVNKVVGGT